MSPIGHQATFAAPGKNSTFGSESSNGTHPWQADDQEAIPDVDVVPDLKRISFTYF